MILNPVLAVSAELNEIRTVTLADWDGTPLGRLQVERGHLVSPDAYEALMNTLVDPLAGHFTGFTFTPNVENEGYRYNQDQYTRPLLSGHGGYTFAGWLSEGAEKFHFHPVLGETPEPVDLAGYVVEDFVTFRACYSANSKCADPNAAFADRRFDFHVLDITNYTGTGNYIAVTFSWRRKFCLASGKFPAEIELIEIKEWGKPSDTLPECTISNGIIKESQLRYTSEITTNLFATHNFNMTNYASAKTVTGRYMVSENIVMGDDETTFQYKKMGAAKLFQTKCGITAENARYPTGISAAHFNNMGWTSSDSFVNNRLKAMQAWRAINRWAGPVSCGDGGTGRELTIAQGVAACNDLPNVYLEYVEFADKDPSSGFVGGTLPLEQIPVDTSVFNLLAPSPLAVGYRVYWSIDGITKGSAVDGSYADGVFTIPQGTQIPDGSKAPYDRLMVCALDGDGNEYPCSAVIFVEDLSTE